MSTTSLTDDVLVMLRESLRHVLTETSSVPFGDRLAELGWGDVVADDASTALRTLFEIKGETVSAADALTPTLARHLAALTGDPAVADATVALPSPFGASFAWGMEATSDELARVIDEVLTDIARPDAPRYRRAARHLPPVDPRPETEPTGATVAVDAIVLSAPKSNVVVNVDGRLALISAEGLTATALQGTDAELGLLRLAGTAGFVRWIDGATWTQLETHARWLLACELVGIGRHVVNAAVEYTKVRVQYGKPIGVFQALQHRLASAHVAVVGAGHLAAEAGVSGDAWVALVAKCAAGRAAEDACTQAQQCYGAIGFTWEHEFHRYLRRTYVLDQLLGNWRTLEHEIGMQLQETGVVRRIGTL
jgi:Acyl-CoA dehydrogenase, C-terminal domain